MPKRRKIGLLVVMAMSLVTMCAALAKITVSLIPLTNSQILGNPAVEYFASIINFSSACEQGLVILMGCIPTLHLATRLRAPSLSKLRGNVSKVFSWSNRSKSSRGVKGVQTDSTKSSFPDSQKGFTGYQEMQLTPKVRPSDADSFEMYTEDETYATSQSALPHWDGNFRENQVLRTDRFSVSYKTYRPGEEV